MSDRYDDLRAAAEANQQKEHPDVLALQAEVSTLKEALSLLLMFDYLGEARPIKRLGQTSHSVAASRYAKLMADRSNSAPISRQMCRDLIMGFTDTPWLARFKKIVDGAGEAQ